MFSKLFLYNFFTFLRVLNVSSYTFFIIYLELTRFSNITIMSIIINIGSLIFLLFRVCTNKYFLGEYIFCFIVFIFNCIEHSKSISIIIPFSISCFDFICTIIIEYLFTKIYIRVHYQSTRNFMDTNSILNNRINKETKVSPQSDYIEINILEYKCENHNETETENDEKSIELKTDCENCICMICLSNMNNEIAGNNNCKHYFHYTCISNYILKANLTKFICPICRN